MLYKYSVSIIITILLFCHLHAEDGDLISYELQSTLSTTEILFYLNSMGASQFAQVDYPISVYKLNYESHRPSGEVDTLGALVCIPQASVIAFPIASYQHGTTALDNDAPSLTGLNINNPEIALVGLISASSGFITLFPDYEGLGDPNKYHPYIVADSYTRAIVNMIRSIKRLSFILEDDEQFQFNDQLLLFGYSEGGYATLAAQKGIEANYSDEMNITVSCPMAGPYDLGGTMVNYFLSIPSYPRPYYVPYVLTSHLWMYEGDSADFNYYFDPFWADTLPSLFDGTHSGSSIDNIMPANPLDILLPEVLEEFTISEDHFFRQTLDANTLLDWIPQSPTYFFHGLGDDIIPYENAQVAYNNFITNGADNINITLYPEVFGGHSEVALTCILGGYNVMKNYQVISTKGDMNNDGIINLVDVEELKNSILLEDSITEFQWWAGDIDSDSNHSVFDLLIIADIVEN